MKIRNCMTASELVISICVMMVKISDCLPGHLQHDFILEYPSPIFSSRSDAEWNGQIVIFPKSSMQGINPWIQNRQAKIKMQKDVKSAGRGEAVHTTADPIPIENSTEVVKEGVPRTTVTVSQLHLGTENLMDKHLNLDTKEEVNTKKEKEEHSSRQLSSSSPITDTIPKPSPMWLESDVPALKQPPVMTNTTVSMRDKSTSVDPLRRFVSKSDNDNDFVSKPKQIPSDVTYVQPEHIIQFNTEGKVHKKVSISDILDRGADYNRTEPTTVNTLNTNQVEDKNISSQGLLNNNQTIIIPENQNYVQKKDTNEKQQRLKQKKEKHGSFLIRRFNRGNVTARATPVERMEYVPTKASGQLKALNQESTSGRKLLPSIVNVDYFYFFLNHSTRKDENIKSSKTSNQSGTITSVNDENWSNGRNKDIYYSENTQMQLNVSKQQRLAVTEQIKRSQDMLDLLYESNLWRVSFFDNRSNFTNNKELHGRQQTGSLKESSIVGKGNVHSHPQAISLHDIRETNDIYTTQQTAYSTTVSEISSDAGNKSYLSMTSLHGESNSTVNDTNQNKVYNGKKYETKQADLKRPESVPELRKRYFENKNASTIKPNYDTKRGNQIGNSIRKELGNKTNNSTSHPDGSSNMTNSMNDTEMHTYSGKLETLNIKLTELPSVLDASKSYADSLNWIQSTIEPNDVSTNVISTPIGVTSTSYSETAVWPKSTVGTLERTTMRDRGLTAEMFMYEDHLSKLDASSTLDSAMDTESNATKGTPIPIVRNNQAKYANSLQSTAQTNHLGTVVDMIIRDTLMSDTGTTAYPYSAVRARGRTAWGSDAELLMFLEFIRTLNEI